MHIVLFCATRRGLRFLDKVHALIPDSELTVFSFREEPHEPPFCDAIRERTEAIGGRFFETRRVGGDKWQDFWRAADPDLMFAVSWRYLIPQHIYSRTRLGCFVFHDALLPACRGFAPTVWAMINGEDHTGATLFHIDEMVDAGPIVDQERVEIGRDETIADVMERVTDAYLNLLERNLDRLVRGTAPRLPNSDVEATYTCKRLPEDNRIDWSMSTERIYNLIRAVARPYSGAFTILDGRKLTIWSADRLDSVPHYAGRIPGRVVEIRPGEGSVVLTGDGAILIREVQPQDETSTCASEILNRLSLTLGR